VLGSREVIKSYKDLEVWKRSTELVEKIYFITKDFSKGLKYISEELESSILEEIDQIGKMTRGLIKNLRTNY
jgi:hypothetical protein